MGPVNVPFDAQTPRLTGSCWILLRNFASPANTQRVSPAEQLARGESPATAAGNGRQSLFELQPSVVSPALRFWAEAAQQKEISQVGKNKTPVTV